MHYDNGMHYDCQSKKLSLIKIWILPKNPGKSTDKLTSIRANRTGKQIHWIRNQKSNNR